MPFDLSSFFSAFFSLFPPSNSPPVFYPRHLVPAFGRRRLSDLRLVPTGPPPTPWSCNIPSHRYLFPPTTFHLSSGIFPLIAQPRTSHTVSRPAFLYATTPSLPGVVTRFHLLSEHFPHWRPYVGHGIHLSLPRSHTRPTRDVSRRTIMFPRPLRSSLRPIADLFIDTL